MIDEFINRLGRNASQHGYSMYLVGGTVRDRILNRPNKDYDMTTDAPVDAIKYIIGQSGADSIFTVGEKHGTIGAIVGGVPVDVTTFRNYDNSIQADTTDHMASLREDLSRRDFTINAMVQNVLTGEIFDPFCGRDDILYKVIMAVGNPRDRFDEDPLRILRAVRFAAQLNFKIEDATKAAIKKMGHKLTTVATERLGDEMDKMLVTAHPSRYIALLDTLDLLKYIIPEMMEMKAMPQPPHRSKQYRYKEVFPHTLQVLDKVRPNLVLRWAALLHDVGKPRTMVFEHNKVAFPQHDIVGAKMAKVILTRLHRPNEVVEPVVQLVEQHLRTHNYDSTWTDGAVRRFIRETAPLTDELFELCAADVTSKNNIVKDVVKVKNDALVARITELKALEDVEKLSSPIDGNEIMAHFNRPPGPWIKAVKDFLLELVLDGRLQPDDKAQAYQIAEVFVQKAGV